MQKARIIQQAANEFIFEFDTQADTKTLKEGQEFKHEGVSHKIMRAYPGILGPSVYTFLVITTRV